MSDVDDDIKVVAALYGSLHGNRGVVLMVPTPSTDDAEDERDEREAPLQVHPTASWRRIDDTVGTSSNGTDVDVHCTCKLYVFMRRTDNKVTGGTALQRGYDMTSLKRRR